MLVDKLISGFNWITEQANPISKTEQKITELGSPIVKHLVKVLKWDDKVHNQKHCKDIDNWLDQVLWWTYKSSKKPKSGKIKFWLWEESTRNRFKSSIAQLNREYGKLPQYRTDEEVIVCIDQIMAKVDEQIQLDNLSSIIEICNLLNIEIKSAKNYWS